MMSVKVFKWMVYVKYAFGVLIFCFAVHYAYLGYRAVFPAYAVTNSAAASAHFRTINGTDHSGLARALNEAYMGNLPVLIDFRADWCKNCRKMETGTFMNPAVARRLGDYMFIKFGCDKPGHPAVRGGDGSFRGPGNSHSGCASSR